MGGVYGTECERGKVSVIIPTYHRSQYIKRAVNSVINQTYKNLEIIIVNDNPPDSNDSQYINFEILDLDKRIKIVNTQGGIGGGAARNIGVKNASGEFLAFLDDDDIYLPEKIEKQLEFMFKTGYEMSIQDVEWYNEKEKLVEYRSFSFINSDRQMDMLKQHILHHLAPTAIYMIKTEAFYRTEGFGETDMGQDWRLMLSCILSDVKIGYMKGAYVRQYLHSGERISLGRNKIVGENSLYEIKKRYLYLLNKKERRYVHFRHYAVLAFSCVRSRSLLRGGWYAFLTVMISPRDSIVEAFKYFRGKRVK